MTKNNQQNNTAMKDSGIDWIGKIPSDWKASRIKNIFRLSNEKINGNAEKYQIYSLTMQGLKKRDITTNEGQIAASYDKYAHLRKEDIVLNPMDLISGFVARQEEDGIISPAYSILRPIKKQNTEYFERYLQFHYFYNIFFPFGKGVSYDYRWTLGDFELMNFPILNPPKQTQEKIVAFLDKKTEAVAEVIAKKKKMIELLKEKRSAIITQAVTKGIDPDAKMKDSGVHWIGKIPEGWEVRKLRKLSRIYTGTTPPTNPDNFNGYYNWFTPGDFNQVPAINSKRKITKAPIKDGAVKVYPPKSVLLIGIGGTLGSVTFTNSFFSCNQQINIIVPHINIYYKYLYYYLSVMKTMIRAYSLVTTLPILNQQMNGLIEILLPAKQIQEKIVAFLDKKTAQIDKAIAKIEEQIKLLEEYKASVIYHAVTGKITV